MTYKKNILLVYISLILITSCSIFQKKLQVEASGGNLSLSETDRIKFTTLFFNATKEKMLENYDQAASLYSQCVRINQRSAPAMYELAGIYTIQGKNEDALFFAKKAAELDPGNKWYQLLLAEACRNNNLFENATGIYARLVKNYPEEIDYYNAWANVLLQMGKFSEAIKIYDMLENKIGVQEDVSIQKQRLYIKTGKLDKATEEIYKLIKANPRDTRYYEMLADMYRANGMFDKALEMLDRIAKIDPSNQAIHFKLADIYRSSGKPEKAMEHLKSAFANPHIDVSAKLGYLLTFHLFTELNENFKDSLIELAAILARVHPEEPRVHAIYGDYLYRDRKLEEAKEQYFDALKIDKNSFAVWNQLVLTLTDLKKYNILDSITHAALELFPEQPVFYLFNGIAAIQRKRYDDAITVLNQGIKLIVDNTSMTELFYANLGDAYYQQGKLAESDSCYDKTLKINPNNAYVLNNYSYYLSLRKSNLDKAEIMSRKANELEPDNSAFQDTYAWVLYGLARYEEAKMWLEKALSHTGSDNGVILEHYGDALFRLGQKEQAMEFWMKAQQTGRHSPELPQKIKEKAIIDNF